MAERRGQRRRPPTGGGRGRPATVDVPRLAAYQVLRTVRADDAYANLVLPTVIAHHALDPRDAGFVTELASGTLRWRGTYDAVLGQCVDRPLSKVAAPVLDVLRLGVHQLLAMRVPTHAAISTSVDLARSVANPGAAGFVNAVLRAAAGDDLDGWIARLAPDPVPTSTRHEEIRFSHPGWIVEELRRAVGAEELHALLAADNVPPAVTLVARPGRAERAELPGEPTPYSPFGVTAAGGAPGAIPAVAEGRAGVQDEGSQLIAIALAEAEVDGRDERWVDLCAGPGGKAALLAALAARRGAAVLAVEPQPHRARLVERALAGSDGVSGVVVADGRHVPIAPASADRVLVDAPCTGLGALRRRPESRWRRRPDDLVELVLLQRALLGAALDAVRPGGVGLYSTCSPGLAGAGGVVSSVVEARADVAIEDVAALLPQVPDCEGPLPGTVQLWPHRHGTDAMFLALLRRS
ncbi:RsmB/NOP family class I SAM-dependent RNA methyltransferase [Nocardioides sp. R-C-SC26]|uniref:RsmB/NOP family class I SAM-dependent RNA methyltransferase n=1 Tax=Nocardioides sp. R-C-SC26 TaxID=2870414 RepID=UPI001E3DA851|nr:transcription antitermination factor NusB [Nocardioides sp. R-C-SC26]